MSRTHLLHSVSFCIFGSWKFMEGYWIISPKCQIMNTERKWVVVRIDGKIAGVSTDYRILADIAARLAAAERPARSIRTKADSKDSPLFDEIKAEAVTFDEVWKLRKETTWNDLMLFGTDFQTRVWRKLWELTHPNDINPDTADNTPAAREDNPGTATEGKQGSRLISYSDFADMCQNRAGVRAVAHAIGLNPISVVIPCHLVVPKETIDKIRDIRKKAESTIFKGEDICLESIIRDKSTDFGQYSLGRKIKRELIARELL